jgi:preprotein translocase subunit SecY
LIPPAEPTAAYLDQALSRTALFGAIYLAAICLGPDIVTIYARVPFHLGGLPLLITVCTALDLETQVRGQLRFDE